MMSPSEIAVEFKGISKFYGSFAANQDVSFQVKQGRVHAIVGENGAGKSTALKILFGLEKPSEGQLFVFGKEIQWSSSAEALRAGLGMVHQHFMLCENETALENFLLTNLEENPFAVLDRKKELAQAQQLSRKFGFEIPWNTKVKDLSVGLQQRLEILKALRNKSKILILDEPTAVLTPQETEELFGQIRKLKEDGLTVLLITHKLKEILSLCDNITVFRKGKVVAEFEASKTSVAQLAEKMVGRPVSFEKRPVQKNFQEQKELIRFKNLKIENKKNKSNFQAEEFHVSKGEIVGLAGIEGHGQDQLIQFLHKSSDWEIQAGESFMAESRKNFFPEDRLKVGAVAGMNLSENFILGHEKNRVFQKRSFLGLQILNWKKIKDLTQEAIEQFHVYTSGRDSNFSSLSGGNQQKLVVARELFHQPELIIAAHPSRGVDVGAIEFIHEKLIQFQEKGAGILLISSELDELIKLSDRLYVVSKGKLVMHLTRKEFDTTRIGCAMGGQV